MTPSTATATAPAKGDLAVVTIEKLSWTPEDTLKSLDAVRCFVEQQATDAIRWYYQKKRPKQTGSRAMRLCAIGLASLGGLTPIAAALPAFATLGLEKLG